MITTGKVVALIQAMGGGADPAVIESAVQDWLDAHPEATTTVQDGSITEQKLATSIAQKLGLITQLSDEIDDIKSDLTPYYNSEIQKNSFGFAIGTLDGTTGAPVLSGNRIRTNPLIFDSDTVISFSSDYTAKVFYYTDAECTTLGPSTGSYVGSPITVIHNKYCRIVFGTYSSLTDPTDNPIYNSIVVSNDLNLANKRYVETRVDAVIPQIVSPENVKNIFVDNTTHTNTYINTSKKGNDPSAWHSNNSFTASNLNAVEPNTTYSVSSLRYNNGEQQMFCDALFYDVGFTYISKTQNAKVFTTPANAKYVAFTFYNTSYANPPTGIDDLSTVIVESSENIVYPIPADRLNGIRQWTGYENKKWMVIGDSITEKNFRAFANYHDFIHSVLGIEIINCGVSGSGYKILDNENKAIYQRIPGYSDYSPDVITIFAGINDIMFEPASAIGEPTDTATDTVFGCAYTAINLLRTTFPNVPIGIISPLPQMDYNTSNSANAEYVFVQKLKEFCDIYCLPFLNMYNNSGFTPWITAFKEKFTSCRSEQSGDGLHPNLYGHQFIYPKIMQFIKSIMWNVDILS